MSTNTSPEMQITHTEEHTASDQVLEVEPDHRSPAGLLKKAF